jgi:hypothetical protein
MLQTYCSLENWKAYFCGLDHVSSAAHGATMTRNGFKLVPAQLISGRGIGELLAPARAASPLARQVVSRLTPTCRTVVTLSVSRRL